MRIHTEMSKKTQESTWYNYSANRTRRALRTCRLTLGLCVLCIIACVSSINLSSQVPCPPEGETKLEHIRRLNLKKNRSDEPSKSDINVAVDFTAMLNAGENTNLFKEGQGATIVGYVAEVKIGALETCNCKEKDYWLRDTHIELTIDPMDEGNKRKLVIVEVTPRFREKMKARGLDWSQKNLRTAFLGRWVRVTGWLFYDANHDDESAGSENTHVWRGTAWELHPVTAIEITVRPPGLVEPTKPANNSSSSTESSSKSSTNSSSQKGSKQCTALTTKGTRCKNMTTNVGAKCWQHSK